MKTFILVKHSWFNSSYGFKQKTITVEDKDEAETKALAWEAECNRKSSMNHHSVCVIDPRDSGFEHIGD